jgi:predicted ArsR family transcriptional regulator
VKTDASFEQSSQAERELHRALGHPSRARILTLLHEAGDPLGVHDLAERVGLHPNTTRAHLRVLEEVGLVASRVEGRALPGRPRIVYEATSESPSETEGYRLLAQILASYLTGIDGDPAIHAEQAGRAWGRFLVKAPAPLTSISAEEAVSRVVQLLDELGFQPNSRVDPEGVSIAMRRCPFADVAGAYEQVVCQVHLGLVQGALEEVGVDIAADRLRPHAEPHLCVVHLVDRTVAA